MNRPAHIPLYDRSDRISICKGLQYNHISPFTESEYVEGGNGVYFDPKGLAVACDGGQVVILTVPKSIANGSVMNTRQGKVSDSYWNYNAIVPKKLTQPSATHNLYDLYETVNALNVAGTRSVYLKIKDSEGKMRGILFDPERLWLCLTGMITFISDALPTVGIHIIADATGCTGYDPWCRYFQGKILIKYDKGIMGIVGSRPFRPMEKGDTEIILS